MENKENIENKIDFSSFLTLHNIENTMVILLLERFSDDIKNIFFLFSEKVYEHMP